MVLSDVTKLTVREMAQEIRSIMREWLEDKCLTKTNARRLRELFDELDRR